MRTSEQKAGGRRSADAGSSGSSGAYQAEKAGGRRSADAGSSGSNGAYQAEKAGGRRYTGAGYLALAGSRILEVQAVLLALVMLLLGGYSLWDMYRVTHASYISEELLVYKPDPEEDPQEAAQGLQQLHQMNGDVAGWITIPGTSVDYPLLQGEDDFTYLNQDVYREYSLSGSIFLSCENQPDLTDAYLMTFGHNMASGAMYADITRYTDAEYFASHDQGTLTGLNTAYDIQFFAVVETDAYNADYYAISRINTDEPSFAHTLDQIYAQTLVRSGRSAGSPDHVIALSTCAQAQTNGRIILFGKLVER